MICAHAIIADCYSLFLVYCDALYALANEQEITDWVVIETLNLETFEMTEIRSLCVI